MKIKTVVIIAVLCIFTTFGATYTIVTNYKDQEMKELDDVMQKWYVNTTGLLAEYCKDIVDEWRFVGYWSGTEISEPVAYEFFFNRTFNAYVLNQTDSTNYSGTFWIDNSMLILTINSSSSAYEYTFSSDDTSVTIDNKPYTRRQGD